MKSSNKKRSSRTHIVKSSVSPVILISGIVVLLFALMLATNTANVRGMLNAFITSKTSTTFYYCGIAVSEQQYNLLNSTGQYQFEGNPCHQYYTKGEIGTFNTILDGGVDGPVTLYDNILLVPLETPTYNNSPPSHSAPNMEMWGGLAAVNATTGALIWEDKFTDSVMTQPLAINGIAYIGTGDDYTPANKILNGIFAINIIDGTIVWKIKTWGQNMPTFVYYNDSIIKSSTFLNSSTNSFRVNPALQAFDPLTGDLKWQEDSINALSAMSSLVLVGNIIYFGGIYQNGTIRRGAVYAINADTHKTVWVTYFPKGADTATQDTTLAIWNNTLIDGFSYTNHTKSKLNQTTNLTLAGLDLTTGKIKWEFYEGSAPVPPRSMLPAFTAYNNIAFSDTTEIGWLYALNMSTGNMLWKFHTGPSIPNPEVIDGHVFAENQTGTVFILNMDGSLYKTINLGTPMGWCGAAGIAQIGDKVVFGGEDGRLITLPISSIIAPG